MKFVQPQMIADAINQFDGPFDVHSVEKRLLFLNTVEVAEEILRYRHSTDVLRTFSDQLAREINRTFRGQIQTFTKVKSENLAGWPSDTQAWKKVVDVVVVPISESLQVGIEEDDSDKREEERVQRAIHAVGLRNAIGRMEDDC